MDEGYDFHMLDITRLAAESWSNVPREIIACCLVKAKFLPVGVQADLNIERRKTGGRSTETMVDELVQLPKSTA